MSKLVKSIRNFIIRDMIYIIGGASVILSFLYVWGKIDVSKKSVKINIIPDSANIIFFIIGIGLAYAVGYCFQEIFSLLHIVKTSDYFRPWFPSRWLYRCLTGDSWEDVFPDIPKGRQRRRDVNKRLKQASVLINEKASQDDKTHREWLSSFISICSTLGPCVLVSGLLILWKILPKFLRSNPEIVVKLGAYFKNSLGLAFLAVVVFIVLMIFIKLSVFLIMVAFMMLIVFSQELSFNIAIVLSFILISMTLMILSWIKGLELMKNTEILYHKFQKKSRKTAKVT